MVNGFPRKRLYCAYAMFGTLIHRKIEAQRTMTHKIDSGGIMSSRSKGKHWELFFVNKLKAVFPDVQRNWNGQTDHGGKDLLHTGPFCCEVKGGKMYKLKSIRDILDQCHAEAEDHEWELSLVKPSREDPYILMPFDDFLEMLERYLPQDSSLELERDLRQGKLKDQGTG